MGPLNQGELSSPCPATRQPCEGLGAPLCWAVTTRPGGRRSRGQRTEARAAVCTWNHVSGPFLLGTQLLFPHPRTGSGLEPHPGVADGLCLRLRGLVSHLCVFRGHLEAVRPSPLEALRPSRIPRCWGEDLDTWVWGT